MEVTKEQDFLPLNDIDSLNIQWFETMLSNYHKTQITIEKYNLDIPDRREGFLSEIVFVKVFYSTLAQKYDENLVFKFFPKDKDCLKFMLNANLAMREVNFYDFSKCKEFDSICKQSKRENVIPTALYAKVHESNFCLVMKDLRTLFYKTIIIQDGLSTNHIKAAFESIAIIHASGLAFKNTTGKYPLSAFEENSFYDQFLLPNLDKLSNFFKDSSISQSMIKLKSLTEEMRSFHLKKSIFETVIHGDMWAGQCMYSPCEKYVSILDWQFASLGSPIIDLMAMLFMSSNLEALEEDLDDIFSHYWKSLTNCLSNEKISFSVTYPEFKIELENHWITGFLFLAVSFHDFIGADNISKERIYGVFNFLQKRNVFEKFIMKPYK